MLFRLLNIISVKWQGCPVSDEEESVNCWMIIMWFLVGCILWGHEDLIQGHSKAFPIGLNQVLEFYCLCSFEVECVVNFSTDLNDDKVCEQSNDRLIISKSVGFNRFCMMKTGIGSTIFGDIHLSFKLRDMKWNTVLIFFTQYCPPLLCVQSRAIVIKWHGIRLIFFCINHD